MKDVNNHENIRQNANLVTKSRKHDANLQKNSTLYFQVGLILCLLASYGALEMRFNSGPAYELTALELDDSDYEYTMATYVPEIEEPKMEEDKPVKKKKVVVLDKYKEVDNDTKEKDDAAEIVTEKTTTKKTKLVDPDAMKSIEKPIEGPFNILAVQKVPIYPGCEGETTNEGRIKCMSKKISKHIDRKFDKDLASELGLKKGRQRIYVQFKINKQGDIEIIDTKGPHKRLVKEANRVINKVPKMMPGLVNNKSVDVLYMVPISFNIE